SACAEACPESAIAYGPLPRLDAGRCTACRLCEAACPTGAIHGDDRSLAALADELAKTPNPVLGCRVPGVQANVHTGCLGFLDAEALMALGLALPAGATLNLTRCKDCVNAAVVAKLEAAAALAQLAQGGAGPARVRLAMDSDQLAFQESGVSRREFFSLAGKRAAQAASSAAGLDDLPPPQPFGERKNLPAGRRLLLEKLAPLTPAERRAADAGLFPGLAFGPACTNCMGCVGMCPTGAIATSRSDPPRPVFVASLCTACGVCAEFCSVKAITLTPPRGEAAAAVTPAAPAAGT
ncbi:MAG TPA: 4Fe-4S binding protein, partial [Pelomicrobium sp.]|nr:4Fe-4S binding protein [Pelomicrobium sp.]